MKPNNKLHVLAALCLAIALSPVAVLAQTSPDFSGHDHSHFHDDG
jgi:hypothetical protein